MTNRDEPQSFGISPRTRRFSKRTPEQIAERKARAQKLYELREQESEAWTTPGGPKSYVGTGGARSACPSGKHDTDTCGTCGTLAQGIAYYHGQGGQFEAFRVTAAHAN